MRSHAVVALVLGTLSGLAFPVPSAVSAKEKELVAVVELSNTTKRLTEDEVQFITDSIRTAASRALDRSQYTVLTRESMDVLLGAGKVVCLAGKCLAEIGKTLQAKYVIGGSLKEVGGKIGITVEVYESATAALLASDVGRAKDVDEAIAVVVEMAPRMMTGVTGVAPSAEPVRGGVARPAPDVGSAGSSGAVVAPPAVDEAGPRVKRGTVKDVFGDLTVSARARDGSPVRIDLVDPSGLAIASASPFKDDHAKVGAWKVTARAAKHQDATQAFQVPPDDVTVVKIDVRRLGDLTVTGRSAGGVAVRLDLVDPSGKTLAAGSPFRNDEAMPGTWKVTARATGHGEVTRTFEVNLDEAPVIAIDLERLGAMKVAGEPDGAAVKVTGPGGFLDEGGLPWEAEGLRSGTYRVEVSRTGYATSEKEVTLEPGRTAMVVIKLEKGDGGPVATDGAGILWVSMPGGAFLMGSDRNDDEKPRHRVTVKGFRMARTETTVKQYRACVQAGACTEPDSSGRNSSCNWGQSGREDHPVNCIDWKQSSAFCRWVGGRLPSEAEWEYAARSGGRDQEYPWGNEAANCSRAVLSDGGNGCGQGRTWPVCSKESGNTAQGLCDMAGNVGEWVQDGYQGAYGGAPVDGSAWESGSPVRVDRGGGWYSGASGLRALFRAGSDPLYRDSVLGGRCASAP